MQISLDEAIDMHSKALIGRLRGSAERSAYEHAARRRSAGDAEGEHVWLRVADAARRLREGDAAEAVLAPRH